LFILVEGLRKLVEDYEYYSDHIQREAPINIKFHLTDTDEKASLTISKTLSVNQGSHTPDIKLAMKKETFNKIISGESDFGSMIGRSKMADKRPIDMEFINRDKTKQIMNTLYALMNLFLHREDSRLKNWIKSSLVMLMERIRYL
jgi:putative sterol carrier protein